MRRPAQVSTYTGAPRNAMMHFAEWHRERISRVPRAIPRRVAPVGEHTAHHPWTENTKMAQQVNVVLVDDLDGTPAEETVTFGLDGISYEIDLTAENAARLRDSLRGVGRPRPPRGRPAPQGQPRRRPSGPRSARTPRRSASGPGPTATRSPSAAASRPTSSRPSTPRTAAEPPSPHARTSAPPPAGDGAPVRPGRRSVRPRSTTSSAWRSPGAGRSSSATRRRARRPAASEVTVTDHEGADDDDRG